MNSLMMDHPSQREGRIKALQKLIAWATSDRCRRKVLLDYFGEPYENENCGMCDNCRKTKIEQVDLTTPAQMFLSCLYRVLDWINKNNTKPEEVFDKAYFVGTFARRKYEYPNLSASRGIVYHCHFTR